jgi:hypothetical protein
MQIPWNSKAEKCIPEFINTFSPSPHLVIIHFKGSKGKIRQDRQEARAFLEQVRKEGTGEVFSVPPEFLAKPPAPVDPNCNQQGFGNGFLWKPESENTGRLVVLFPKNYQRFSAVVLFFNGQILEALSYRTVANGGRLHYDGSKHGGEYPDGTWVVADDVCWRVDDTSNRAE